jgi:hypothetical protein
MISTFGPEAERLRGALLPELHAIVFDENTIAAATAEALARRERGERFYGFALLDDLRVQSCNQVAVAINHSVQGAEIRARAVRELGLGTLGINNKPAAALWDPATVSTRLIKANFVLALSDELLVRSFFEYRAYAGLPHFNSHGFRRVRLAATLPAFEPQRRDSLSVLVWTGRRKPADATLALLGLEAFRGEVSYVAGAPIPNVPARFLARDDPGTPAALAEAGCIVCIDPADPADAVAFAQRGVPVVAPLTCAAYEFADGVVSWDAADGASLSEAVASARALYGPT